MSAIKTFMEWVTVWPGVNNPGWINLHCHLKNPEPLKNEGKPWVIGWAHKDVDAFLKQAAWVTSGGHDFYDSWFCTSQQSEATKNAKGKFKAVRKAKYATWLKAIWIDVDVKPDDTTGKHYTTMEEAWAAFIAFRAKVGLPAPSAVVNSGGGLHIYWISDAPLTPEDWRPYAEGLKALLVREGVKCDSGLTTDNSRLLRVPGTTNHKYSPARPVQLLHLNKMFKFETDLLFLKGQSVTPNAVNLRSNPNSPPPADPVEPGWTATAPDPAFAGLTGGNALQAGVSPTGPFLVDPAPILQKCGFLGDALRDGGQHYDNPLWNLSVLCTAFMEDGDAIAHQISKGHAGYSQASTQALYDRKVEDRADRGIGYPSCATIAGAGCKACQTCPLLKNGKSPLNIRPVPSIVTATVTAPVAQSPDAIILNLPAGYEVDGKGIICKLIASKRPNEEPIWAPLFLTRIDMPWVQKDPDVIHFRASYDKGNTIQTSVRVEDMCGPGFEKKLAMAKVKFVSEYKSHLEGFFMAWLEQMHSAAVAQTAQAFGWYREAGVVRGFAYGGLIHRDDGSTAQAGLTDKVTQRRFQPTGQLAPWHAAAGYILRQQRSDLDVVLATAFAAPLIEMTGTTGAMISAWGQSGVGKTYALEVGAAVWGHPKESKEVTSSTWKSVERRLSSTVNLPVYWDEITNEAAQKNVHEMLMLSSGGVRGGRLKQNTEQMEKGTWSTLVSINSNLCFTEYVARCQPTHTAGLNRVLEYQVLLSTSGVGKASASEAAQALAELSHHYGNLGLDYAKVLGQNHEVIRARIDTVLGNLEGLLKPGPEDRFWIGTMAAIIVGAELARDKLNVPFDMERIATFLVKVFGDNQANRTAAGVTPTTADYAEDVLVQFIKANNATSVWVENTPNSPGRAQQPAGWKRLFPNAPLVGGVSIRYDQTTKDVMISRATLKAWLHQNRPGSSFSQVVQTLKRNYGAQETKKKLNAGTPFPGGQEHVLVISALSGQQDLLDEVNRQFVDNSALGASAGMSASQVDTGITQADEEVKRAANE